MELWHKLVDLIFHLSPEKLSGFVAFLGIGKVYAVLFLIIFAETGFVITPFLPGDSLLFTLGVVGAHPDSPVHLPLAMFLLTVAAVLGDAANYWIGFRVGPKVFRSETSWLLNKKHLLQAQEFYEKYGGKAIILARFVPIVRTFAPFVAGIGRMNYFRFFLYNVVGGIAWVAICTLGGYFVGRFFSENRLLKNHFELIIVVIVAISVLPMVWEFWRARQQAKRAENSRQSAVGTKQ